MFGWMSLREAERYTQEANREKLRLRGASLLAK
jgi:hypothetical protein